MSARWNYRRIAGWPLAALTVALLAAGCGPEPKIRKYTVPKLAVTSSQPAAKPAAGKPQTMLGAIVLAGPKAWFFKVTGEPEVVARHRDEVQEFVRSVSFSQEEPPRWQLPEGWKERPGDSFRHATLEIAGAMPPLELAVSSLDRGGTDDAQYVLQNVNRWRGQVGLPATTGEDLKKEVEQFTIGEFSCTWVELTGTAGGGMGGPFAGGPFAGGPFAGGGLPQDHPPVGSASSTSSRGEPAKLTYEVPEGWKELAPNSIRQARFEVSADGQQADVSVASLSLRAPNAGDHVANVNRWRGMVGLAAQSAEEVAKSASEVQGGDLTWKVVHIVGQDENGEPQAILAAMTTTAEAAWFVKLTGPPPLAESQKQHFEQFVKSLKIESQ